MKHRESTLKKLEGLESNLTKLNLAVRQGNKQLFDDTIDSINEQISQIRLYIESEPIHGSELNKF